MTDAMLDTRIDTDRLLAGLDPRIAACLRRGQSRPLEAGRIPGLNAQVNVSLDDRGVPRIEGSSLDDVMCALGYVTARARFFQMDLMRRHATGRLAEWFGASAVPLDRHQRMLGFERAAAMIRSGLNDGECRQLDAYTKGINGALAQNSSFEHHLLKHEPRAWRVEDSILVGLLQTQRMAAEPSDKRMLEVMRERLPSELLDFMLPDEDQYSVSVDGRAVAAREAPLPLVALAEQFSAARAAGRRKRQVVRASEFRGGSNVWAVAGRRACHGAGILANDVHLHLTMPSVAYQVSLEAPALRACGMTIPGLPIILAGSNGHVAWGVTRLVADTMDLIELELSAEDPTRYWTGREWGRVETTQESIDVLGAEPVVIETRMTHWGPIVLPPLGNRALALRWTALEANGFDLGLSRMLTAENLERALDSANHARGPALNVVVADRDGRVGWTVMGSFPKRDARVHWVVRPRRGEESWASLIEPAALPRLVDPESGFVVNANNASPEHFAHGEPLHLNAFGGARAQRISSLLSGEKTFDAADLGRMQHDTSAEFYEFYRELALEVLSDAAIAARPLLDSVRAAIRAWDGTASTSTPGLALLVLFRELTRETLFAASLHACVAADDAFTYPWNNHEQPLRMLLRTHRPELVPPPHSSRERFLLAELELAGRYLVQRNPHVPLDGLTWGEVNRAGIHHPLSALIPPLGALLDIPDVAVPGSSESICVGWPGFGAAIRLVVAPGHEADGVMSIPGGQSGDPLDVNYRDRFEAWLTGRGDPITVRRSRQPPVSFSPAHTTETA